MHRVVAFFVLLIVTVPLSVLAADDFAGTVKNVHGAVVIKRQGKMFPAEMGMKVYVHDMIRTDSGGAVGIILQDNTIFSLGSDSELELEEFVFMPRQRSFAMLARMIRGTFVYMSGLIGKLSPDSVKIETPVGNIGIRGTRFAAKIHGE